MKRFSIVILQLAILLSFSLAQTADDIIDRYYENSGGKERFRAIETIHITGVLPTPQGEFTFEIYQKSPNKVYVTADIMGQRIIPRAFDGETAWSLNPFLGDSSAQIMPDDEARVLKEEAYLDGPLMNYESRGFQVTYEGTGEKNNKACHIIKLVKNLDDESNELTLTCYMDTETYFPLVISRFSNSGQYAGQAIENYYDNYRDIGNGLIMSYNMETMVNGQSIQKLEFKSIVINEDIPDELFAFPGD